MGRETPKDIPHRQAGNQAKSQTGSGVDARKKGGLDRHGVGEWELERSGRRSECEKL